MKIQESNKRTRKARIQYRRYRHKDQVVGSIVIGMDRRATRQSCPCRCGCRHYHTVWLKSSCILGRFLVLGNLCRSNLFIPPTILISLAFSRIAKVISRDRANKCNFHSTLKLLIKQGTSIVSNAFTVRNAIDRSFQNSAIQRMTSAILCHQSICRLVSVFHFCAFH